LLNKEPDNLKSKIDLETYKKALADVIVENITNTSDLKQLNLTKLFEFDNRRNIDYMEIYKSLCRGDVKNQVNIHFLTAKESLINYLIKLYIFYI